MSNRIVRPVRAWADYDEWSVYIEDYWSGTDNPLVDRQWFRRYDIPKHGPDRFRDDTGAFSVVHSLYRPSAARIGPLRSLRVLYENGYELKVRSRDGMIPGTSESSTLWDWGLSAPLTPGVVYAVPGPVASGSFPEDKDSEAVERAMIAAAAWFTQAEQR